MKTFDTSQEGIRQAADIIRAGGVILWPSCGVYGLACHARDREAVERIYSMKTRERNKPLPVIVNRGSACEYGDIGDAAGILIERYWPGFLGIVVPKKAGIPDFVTAGRCLDRRAGGRAAGPEIGFTSQNGRTTCRA